MCSVSGSAWPCRRFYQLALKQKVVRIYFDLVLLFFLSVLFICLFVFSHLVSPEGESWKGEFLVWIFLYNENLAVELLKHLTEKKPDQLALGCVAPDAGWCLTKLQPK